jgi:hypothetical protein
MSLKTATQLRSSVMKEGALIGCACTPQRNVEMSASTTCDHMHEHVSVECKATFLDNQAATTANTIHLDVLMWKKHLMRMKPRHSCPTGQFLATIRNADDVT